MGKKLDTKQVSIYLSDEMYKTLQKLSSKTKVSMATTVRKQIEKGLSINSYSEELETIRQMIHNELEVVTQNGIERLIKLQVKATKASAISMFVYLSFISDNYIDEASFRDVYANACKLAAEYMRQKSKTDDEYAAEAVAALNKIKTLGKVNDN